MANSHMTFGVDLLPKTTNTYSLGNSNQKWKIYGEFAPLDTRTYTDVIATEDSNSGAGFFYLRIRGDSYNSKWYIKTRVLATVPGQEMYETDTIFELWGRANTYNGYMCNNKVKSTYLPIYYNSYFRPSETGYNNNCSGWIGFNLLYSTYNTNTAHKRTVVVELLDYKNCEVELQDTLITPDNIPNRATHTAWYSSTNTSYDNFNAYSQGLKQTGDVDTTTISSLYHYRGNFIANSAIYRYQLLFHTDEDKLTPLNNDNNVVGTTKTMLTDIEILPFEEIFYWNSSSTVNQNANISAGSLLYSYSGIDLRYSFNITTSTLTANKNVYLILSPTTGQKTKLASTTSTAPLTQTLPDTRDGFLYLLLGRAYSGYQISLYPKHPIYLCKGMELVLKSLKPTIVYNDGEDESLELVSGSLRVPNTIYTTTAQFQAVYAPIASGETTYGPGTSGQILKSNGTSVYWATPDTAAATTKLLSFSITTSNWTSSAGSYVYTISDSFVTENTAAIVNMNNSYNFLLSNLQVITGSGTVTFSTETIPSDTISGVLVLQK